MALPLLFLSYDVEADGPCPGLSSLLSLGIAGFNESGEVVFEYEANLMPLADAKANEETMRWWMRPEQHEAWEYVQKNRRPPNVVFQELKKHIDELKKKYRIGTVAWPANYDWQWINYYFHRFVGENPIGFSSRCIATYAWCMAKNRGHNDRIDMTRWTDPRFPHTHKALDDAKEQGAMFIKMWRENVMSAVPVNIPATITSLDFDSLGC